MRLTVSLLACVIIMAGWNPKVQRLFKNKYRHRYGIRLLTRIGREAGKAAVNFQPCVYRMLRVLSGFLFKEEETSTIFPKLTSRDRNKVGPHAVPLGFCDWSNAETGQPNDGPLVMLLKNSQVWNSCNIAFTSTIPHTKNHISRFIIK